MEERKPNRRRANEPASKQGGGTLKKVPGLTKEAIVAAALAQIDKHGLAGFNLRALAQALGVYPTAIYWYVPTRNAILAEVLEKVIGDIVPTSSTDWQGWIRQTFTACRCAIRAHPNVAPLLGAHLVSNTTANLSLVEGMLAALTEAGFSGARLIAAYNTLLAGLVGFTTQEFASMPDDAPTWQRLMQDRVESLRGGPYPMIDAHLDQLANKAFIMRWQNGIDVPLDEGFSFYVETVIAGIAAMAQRLRDDKKVDV